MDQSSFGNTAGIVGRMANVGGRRRPSSRGRRSMRTRGTRCNNQGVFRRRRRTRNNRKGKEIFGMRF